MFICIIKNAIFRLIYYQFLSLHVQNRKLFINALTCKHLVYETSNKTHGILMHFDLLYQVYPIKNKIFIDTLTKSNQIETVKIKISQNFDTSIHPNTSVIPRGEALQAMAYIEIRNLRYTLGAKQNNIVFRMCAYFKNRTRILGEF